MSWWTERQKKDPFVKEREKKQYISRAYFKIEEIQQRYQIIKKGDFIFDLGAAPGSWSQYFLQFSDNIYAVDLLDNFKIKKTPKINFRVLDVFSENILNDLPEMNFVCSDMAPNMSGNKFVDQARTIQLCERALEIAVEILKNRGNFCVKIFKGDGFDLFLKKCKQYFRNVFIFKPLSSRKESKEIYVIALSFKK